MKINNSTLLWIGGTLVVLLIAAVVFSVFQITSIKNERDQAFQQKEELEVNNEQLSLAFEKVTLSSVEELDDRLNSVLLENNIANADGRMSIETDTIYAKYTMAKNRIQELLNELNSQKTKSNKRIQELQNEINTLRGLLKHYIAQVDSLSKENLQLKTENREIQDKYQNLSSSYQQATSKINEQNERLELAEKLNVTNVSLTPLNKKGKNEKNITKAHQLLVSFTIPQNNSTPPGNKTIYLLIISPDGPLGSGTFNFEGGSVPYTASKTIEYSGAEIPNVNIYWDVNMALTKGDYTVELFIDNYRLISKQFSFKK